MLAALLSSLLGCHRKQLSSAEIRAVTLEFVSAAKKVTGGKAEVGLRPELSPPAERGAGRQDRASPPLVADHLYLTLPAGRAGRVDPAELAALEQVLDQVASRHGLGRSSLPGAVGIVRFDYRRGNQRTHWIHIITPTVSPGSSPKGPSGRVALLAIIVDDLGYERGQAEALLALPYPLTLAVLPHLPYSVDIAEEASRRGYQVMLHMPMESTSDEKAEAVELRRGMSPADVRRLLDGMLETVPHAAGVNNHQGSLATADPQLMAALMPALHERNLFFIDSRTTPRTVAQDAAARRGVPVGSRNVFLDDLQTPKAVRQQLELAARRARQQGTAIAIGHPHPVTIQALQEFLPRLEARGVGLVFVSQLVR